MSETFAPFLMWTVTDPDDILSPYIVCSWHRKDLELVDDDDQCQYQPAGFAGECVMCAECTLREKLEAEAAMNIDENSWPS